MAVVAAGPEGPWQAPQQRPCAPSRRQAKGRAKHFEADTKRAIDVVYCVVGDLPLSDDTREQACAVRDNLMGGRKTTSVRRQNNTIKAVFAYGLRELEIDARNRFSGLEIANLGNDSKNWL